MSLIPKRYLNVSVHLQADPKGGTSRYNTCNESTINAWKFNQEIFHIIFDQFNNNYNMQHKQITDSPIHKHANGEDGNVSTVFPRLNAASPTLTVSHCVSKIPLDWIRRPLHVTLRTYCVCICMFDCQYNTNPETKWHLDYKLKPIFHM